MLICVYLHDTPRADIAHVLYMPKVDFQPRTDHSMPAVGFGFSFGLVILKILLGINPKNYGGGPSPLLALILFLKSFHI